MAGATYTIRRPVRFSPDGAAEDWDGDGALATIEEDGSFARFSAQHMRILAVPAAPQTFRSVALGGLSVLSDADGATRATPAPPTITYVPADGTPIVPAASLQVDVTSDSDLAAVTIGIRYPAGGYEVVYDGQVFAVGYSGSMSTLSNGLRFTFSRVGGYPATPALIVIAVDSFGQVTRT